MHARRVGNIVVYSTGCACTTRFQTPTCSAAAGLLLLRHAGVYSVKASLLAPSFVM
jgi:hypothetical protein